MQTRRTWLAGVAGGLCALGGLRCAAQSAADAEPGVAEGKADGKAAPKGGKRKPKEPMPDLDSIQYSGAFDVAPKWKFFPKTVFPPFLIEEGVSGNAFITFRITWEGFVHEAKVVETNHAAFGSAALATVSRMVFHPAKKAGKPVNATGIITFRFEYE